MNLQWYCSHLINCCVKAPREERFDSVRAVHKVKPEKIGNRRVIGRVTQNVS